MLNPSSARRLIFVHKVDRVVHREPNRDARDQDGRQVHRDPDKPHYTKHNRDRIEA
jgi:hypothetical protein